MRDGLGVRAERGGVEIAIVGGLVADPVLGVRCTSLGVSDGRIVAIGRAGNPDTMDGIDVVLDTATAVVDATGMIVTPGGVDPHVHWLSPQVVPTALAGGLTTLAIQDYGPVWNLGTNPAAGLAATWAALEAHPVNAVLLVRASSARPEPAESALRAGGGGLKIHEDVSAGPEQIRCALDIADRHDVQLAIHTDGLNEALSLEDTYAAFGGRTIHAFHIEGCGGGHAPDLLALSGRERVLHLLDDPDGSLRRRRGGRAPGHGGRRARAGAGRPRGRLDGAAPSRPPADDGRRGRAARPRRDPDAVLGLAGNGQGRRGLPARAPERRRDEGGARRRGRARRQRARAAAHREGHDQSGDRARAGPPRRLAGGRQAGRRGAVAAAVRRRPARAGAQERHLGLGRFGRRQRDDRARRARPRPASGRRGRRRGRAAVARVPGRLGAGGRAAHHAPARARPGLPRADRRRHGPQRTHRGGPRGPAQPRRHAGRRARRGAAGRARSRSRAGSCSAERAALRTRAA